MSEQKTFITKIEVPDKDEKPIETFYFNFYNLVDGSAVYFGQRMKMERIIKLL